MLMRNLWAEKLDWDIPLCEPHLSKWVQFFKEMLQIPKLSFARSIKPPGTCNNPPVLVTFSDASKEAFGCCCYIRWEMHDGQFEAYLVISKSRVAPLKTATIVRLELSAAVLAKRLRVFLQESLRIKFNRVVHITDSEIVRAMINKDSYGFNTFVATRIGEIQAATDPSEWYWIDSKHNIADIISRGEAASNINNNSKWHRGPDFLRLPVNQWPILQAYNSSDELPEKINHAFSLKVVVKNSENPIQIERFSNYIRLLRVTARILCLRVKKPNYSLRNLSIPIQPHHLEDARLFWIKDAQAEITAELIKGLSGAGKFRRLNVKKRNSIYVAVGRTEFAENTYSNNELIILPGKHHFSKLYASFIHNRAHRGVRADIAVIRTEFWILGLQRLVRSIKYNCVTCLKSNGKLEQQIMAPLPIERLKPSPPWYTTGLDLFGPFYIKGEVNKRSSGKGYGVIFTCLVTRAVHIDIATDYSTDAFLLVFRRFVSIRGYPNKQKSDSGSQLKSASKEIFEMFNGLDWKRLKDLGTTNGLEWKFSPGDAPWYNGCCESLIRSVKKSISHAIGDNRLTYMELQTIFFESSNIVNERPVGATPTSVDDGSYLCPNDMLLGRSSNKVPAGNFDITISSRKRIYFIQRLADTFWKKWMSSYFPSLLERPKWHHAKRNLSVGDVVIIYDKGLRRGQWKLGIISKVFSGNDNIVRRVMVRYVNPSCGTPIEVERPVQRLVVLLAAGETN